MKNSFTGAIVVLAALLAGCQDGGRTVRVAPAEQGIKVSADMVRSALGEMAISSQVAAMAASAAQPHVIVDRSVDSRSYLCLDVKNGPVRMDYGSKGQFKRTLSDASTQTGFRFMAREPGQFLVGIQYGKAQPSLYKTTLSSGQSAELWTDARTGEQAMRCFRSIGQEYVWFDASLANAVDWLSAGSWQCSGPLASLGSFAVDEAGRTRVSSGGSAQWFIWSLNNSFVLDVFQSPQAWMPLQASGVDDRASTSTGVDLGAMIFTSVAEYTLDFSELGSGKWSYQSSSGAGGSCILRR